MLTDAASELGALEARRQAAQQHLESALDEATLLAREAEDAWGRVCRFVVEGGAEEALPLRDPFAQMAEARLAFVRDLERLAGGAEGLGLRLAQLGELRVAIAELERLVGSVLPRWRTGEDLKLLACEWLTPPQAQLEELARQVPPPPEWFAEQWDEKPW